MDERTMKQLEAYLDGLLPQHELDAFERRLNADAELRQALSQQRDIEQSMRRLMAASDACDEVLARALNAGPGDLAVSRSGQAPITELPPLQFPAPRPSQLWRTFAAAAFLMLSVGVAWMAWTMVNRSSGPPTNLTVAEFYHLKLDAGWKPAWVCRNDQEFADQIRKRMGQPLMIAAMPAGLAAGGIDSGELITPGARSVAVLGAAGDQKILIFITERDSKFDPPPTMKKLNIFHRELGEFMMYEVTPLSESRLMEYFYVPEA